MFSVELYMNGTSVIHPPLAYTTILGVMRQGIGQTEVSVAPVGRQFRFTYSSGLIEFDPDTDQNLVPDPTAPATSAYEKIHVLYK